MVVAGAHKWWRRQAERPGQAWGLWCGDEEGQPLEEKRGGVKGTGCIAYLWGMGEYMLSPDLERHKKPCLLQMS